MSEPQSPLTRLVLFIVCLAIAGSIIAGAHYFTIDLPAQKNAQAPSNLFGFGGSCLSECNSGCSEAFDACVEQRLMDERKCRNTHLECGRQCTITCACDICTTDCGAEYTACLVKPGYTEGDCAGLRNTCESACPC
jgi:hypothetical protein